MNFQNFHEHTDATVHTLDGTQYSRDRLLQSEGFCQVGVIKINICPAFQIVPPPPKEPKETDAKSKEEKEAKEKEKEKEKSKSSSTSPTETDKIEEVNSKHGTEKKDKSKSDEKDKDKSKSDKKDESKSKSNSDTKSKSGKQICAHVKEI